MYLAYLVNHIIVQKNVKKKRQIRSIFNNKVDSDGFGSFSLSAFSFFLSIISTALFSLSLALSVFILPIKIC